MATVTRTQRHDSYSVTYDDDARVFHRYTRITKSPAVLLPTAAEQVPAGHLPPTRDVSVVQFNER